MNDYRPTYAKDSPLVKELTVNGECFRCKDDEPRIYMLKDHPNFTFVLNKRAIPHTCELHEKLLRGEDVNTFDTKVWFQVSRKFRMVARLPEGMNGNEALVWAIREYRTLFKENEVRNDNAVEWAKGLNERDAADQFLRCYTDYKFAKHLQKELTPDQFEAFRKAGGGTYR